MNVRAVLACMALGAMSGAQAQVPPLVEQAFPVEAGRALFTARCAVCHIVEARRRGDLLDVERTRGPDLSFAGTRLRAAWMRAWLVAPKPVRPAGYLPHRAVVSTARGDVVDPSRLPAHPALSPRDAELATVFLASRTRDLNPHPTEAANAGIRAWVHFNRLLPCGACHRVGAGDGGISGPDLSGASTRLSTDWLAAYVSDPPYWQAGLMPLIPLRSDQLTAIVDMLAQPNSTAPAASLPSASVAALPVPEPTSRPARIYRLLCSQCHGLLGNGKGINAPHMFVAPRNHTSAPDMATATLQTVSRAIRYGGPAVGKSALMPAWGAVLAPADIDLLADYVLSLSGSRGARTRAQTP